MKVSENGFSNFWSVLLWSAISDAFLVGHEAAKQRKTGTRTADNGPPGRGENTVTPGRGPPARLKGSRLV